MIVGRGEGEPLDLKVLFSCESNQTMEIKIKSTQARRGRALTLDLDPGRFCHASVEQKIKSLVSF